MGNVTQSPVNDFKRVEEHFNLYDNFRKSYNDDSDEGCFFKVEVQYRQPHNDLPFFVKK